jgi:hypothetical protein
MATLRLLTHNRQVSNSSHYNKQLADYDVKPDSYKAGQFTRCAEVYFRCSGAVLLY